MVQFHQVQTSANITLRHVLFDVRAAPKNKKNILTTKRRWVTIRFLILFGSHISRFQGLSRRVMLVYYSRESCTLRAHSLAALHFFQRKGRRFVGRVSQVNNRRSQNVLGCYLLPAPGSILEVSSFGWIYLCLSYFEGKVKSKNRKLHFITQLKVLKKPF